jgi:Flp pilus assembly protein TadG
MVRCRLLKRLPWRDRPRTRPLIGQALVEFALVGTLFFTLVFGALDVGRAVFQYSEIENAVREGGRVAKVQPCNDSAITTAVTDHGTGQGLDSGDVSISRTGCTPPGNVTVNATFNFTPIVGDLLGISPITSTVSTTVEIE